MLWKPDFAVGYTLLNVLYNEAEDTNRELLTGEKFIPIMHRYHIKRLKIDEFTFSPDESL